MRRSWSIVGGLLVSLAPLLGAETVRICFEAVSAERIEPPMTVAWVSNAPPALRASLGKELAKGRYLEIPQGAGNPPKVEAGEAVFRFDAPVAGEYHLWCRVWWSDECGNSFWISLNGAKPFVFGENATFKTWHWVKAPARLKQLTLEKGPQTLAIRNREDGVAISQILLTTDRTYVPVGEEPLTQEPTP